MEGAFSEDAFSPNFASQTITGWFPTRDAINVHLYLAVHSSTVHFAVAPSDVDRQTSVHTLTQRRPKSQTVINAQSLAASEYNSWQTFRSNMRNSRGLESPFRVCRTLVEKVNKESLKWVETRHFHERFQDMLVHILYSSVLSSSTTTWNRPGTRPCSS